MTIGSWTPANEATIERAMLDKGLSLARKQSLESLPEEFTQGEIERYAPAMKLTQSQWEAVLADYSSEELRLLIHFFTRAEMLLPGWDAGESSPAIWANKLLKRRGERLSPEDLHWLRENTSNRFIPNGSL